MPVKSKESVGPCELSLDIEVESTKVAQAVDRAYREFSKFIAVPGFRKGKAPMSFVKPRVPQDQLRERAAELLVGPAYEQALSENEIQPYARPRVELTKLETNAPDYFLEFKAIVPLPPKVTLGEYKGVAVTRERWEITDTDVDQRIEAVRTRAAEYPLIEDRAAQSGDIVAGELSITIDGGEPGEFRQTAITLGDPDNIPGVNEQVIGVNAGDEKEFDLSYPENYPNAEVAGKSAHFVLRVKDLHSRILPDLDGEFAKKFGGVETIAEMRLKFREEMDKAQLQISEAAMESQLVDKIVENSTVEFPPVLIDIEMEDDVRELREDLERRQTSFEDYLEERGATQESLAEEFRTRARLRLERGLALGEIARTEGLQLSDEDVDKEIQTRADAQRTSVQAMRAFIDRSNGMEQLRNQAYTRKILSWVTDAARITDKVIDPNVGVATPRAKAPKAKAASKAAKEPEASEPAAEAKPKAVKPRKKKTADEGGAPAAE